MTRRFLLKGAQLLDPEASAPVAASLLIEGGRIFERREAASPVPEGAEVVDLGGLRLAPGLIDVHFHGEAIFGAAENLVEAGRRDSRRLARHGVTAFLPTTVAWPREPLRRRVMAWVDGFSEGSWPGAIPLGLHLEGPWIQSAAAGAQPPIGIRAYEAGEGSDLFDRCGGWLRMVTFAPEAPGADRLQCELERREIIGSIGHSLADERVIRASIDRGARHATHLFNAMGGLHHREPGVAATVLAEDRLSCDLIADGHHVHPDWVRTAVRAKGDRIILISDRIDPPDGAGTESEGPDFGSGPLVADGDAWRLPNGTLAGSRLTLDRAILNVSQWDVMTQHDAVAACTLRPARLLGIEAERGTLRVGARADLTVFGEDGTLRQTWIDGQPLAS